MRRALYLSALAVSIPAAFGAQLAEQDAYRQLASGLREEVRLLSGITDAATAAAAVEPLRLVLRQLSELQAQVDERELWRYIENTPDLKQPLIEETERLFVQMQRLEKAACYHHAPLQKLMAPLFNPAS